MYAQQLSNSVQSVFNNFLDRINYNNVHSLPYNNNARILAALSRNGRRIRTLTGKDLMKQNVMREAHRLQIYNRFLINLATDHIWNLRSTDFQRYRFINLANNTNNINQKRVPRIRRIRRINNTNTNTLDRIAQITTPQITNNSFEN